jgi:hypothetical protein
MIDMLHAHLVAVHALDTAQRFGRSPGGDAFVTLHRSANVDYLVH